MSRPTQSKAQTEANAKILRALVKHPDNKVCVDCKKNDPRWASWNIGCFLCIRCSGIHRSMGTHISKVKSIDLDIWTPEQMDSIQKWGNRRCNLYWEAHLKAGHIPPDHKIESFIRSKYESRRWAKDGPPPSDPSVLDGASPAPAAATTASVASASSAAASSRPAAAPAAAPPKKAAVPAFDLLDDPAPAPVAAPAPSTTSSAVGAASAAANKPAQAPAQTSKAAGGAGGGIFDLDWHEPASSSSATSPTSPGLSGAAKGKNDIMSLFAAKAAAAPATAPMNNFSDFGSFSSGATAQTPGSSGLGGLDSSFGGLDLGSGGSGMPKSTGSASTAPPPMMGSNPWSSSTVNSTSGSASTGNGLFDTHDVWGSSGATQSKAPPKNDAFADIWGDFK
ncbi:ArfGap-domain-containing protein [Testicularia cyperi]|uniref:ArfGap-domain-containing protein n=1 Tax=Testicularia cyperi TaxID=1882483 RepID=A0A317XNK6_9BASI|nr:ArfGap-domain-containing protein [Testicularia cyperi]